MIFAAHLHVLMFHHQSWSPAGVSCLPYSLKALQFAGGRVRNPPASKSALLSTIACGFADTPVSTELLPAPMTTCLLSHAGGRPDTPDSYHTKNILKPNTGSFFPQPSFLPLQQRRCEDLLQVVFLSFPLCLSSCCTRQAPAHHTSCIGFPTVLHPHSPFSASEDHLPD